MAEETPMLRAILRSIFGSTTTTPPTPAADEQKAMVTAILALRKIVKSGSATDIVAALDAFKAETRGRLDEREAAAEVVDAQTMLAALSCEERVQHGEGLAPVATMSDGQPSYYRGRNVSLTGPGKDDFGQLDIGDKGLFYEGEKRLTIPWSKVLTVALSERSLIVHRSSGGEPYDLGLSNHGQARLAHLAALTILKQQSNSTAPNVSHHKPRSQQNRPVARPPRAEEPLSVGTTIELPGHGRVFAIHVVGESHRQAALKALSGDRRLRGEYVAFTAALVPEPQNAYDPNAIAVYISGGTRVGYLSREDAEEYREVAKRLTALKAVGLCQAKLIGGTPDKPSIGVVLDVAYPGSTLAALMGNDQPF
jgi:hypothetical protein